MLPPAGQLCNPIVLSFLAVAAGKLSLAPKVILQMIPELCLLFLCVSMNFFPEDSQLKIQKMSNRVSTRPPNIM